MPLRKVLNTIISKAESDLLDGLKGLNPQTPAEGILYGSSWLIASIGVQYDQAFHGRIIERTVCAGAFALGGVVSAVKGVTARRRPLLQSAVEHREN